MRGNRQTKHIHMVLEPRKCLHLYHYFQHEELGLCHVRVQTWFPFTVDLCLNGRDRLARQMGQAGLAYRQRDNCFIWVQEAARAQALLAWISTLTNSPNAGDGIPWCFFCPAPPLRPRLPL